MAVVIGVTILTLSLTHGKVEAAYRAMLQQQFQREMDFFFEKQETRLASVRGNCRQLANSVRLLAAMESEVEAAQLYDIALDELRGVLGRADESVEREAGSAPERATFFRLLDAKGAVLDSDKPMVGLNRGEVKLDLQKRLSQLGPLLIQSPLPQQVGYLPVQNDNGKLQLNEVIVTKMVDPETQQVRGALALGFSATEVSSRDRGGQGLAGSGIWLGGRLYNVADSKLGEAVTPELQTRLSATRIQAGDFLWSDRAQLHQVFYKVLNPDSQFPPALRVTVYSLAGLEQQQQDWSRQILSLGTMGLIGGLLLGLFFAHGLSAPIRQLVAGTRQIQAGRFDVVIPVRSRDEIGRLTEAFNNMAKDLALKEKYRSVLDMVADPKVAEQLLHGDLTLQGEIRDASVLFCDVRGFTALTENMEPSQVIDLLNEHMSALTKVVYDDQGVVDKFVGDLIMALFGAPRNYGNDAGHAVHCALKMIEVRARLNQTSQYRLDVGIGIASGKVIAGCMGAADRNNYTVLGERVNLASRLCSKAGRNEVIIDVATRRRIGDSFLVEPLKELQLKGFSAVIEAFKVVGIRGKDGGEVDH